jgi:hypothetical protein
MFNLIVSGNEDAYSLPYIQLEEKRCLKEFTSADLQLRFSKMSSEQITEIKSIPTIFCYEIGIKNETYLGLIKRVIKSDNKVKIYYVFKDKFINNDSLRGIENYLDIDDWEFGRSHWSLKDIDLGEICKAKGIVVPDWITKPTPPIDLKNHKFEVAMSFSGKYRNFVNEVANELERILGKDKYFYDQNYKQQLAMPSMDLILQNLYKNNSKLVVVFFGSSYQEKEWCGIEFRAIRDILYKKENKRIMYIKMEDGDVDGILHIDGYIDARESDPLIISSYIRDRLITLNSET